MQAWGNLSLTWGTRKVDDFSELFELQRKDWALYLWVDQSSGKGHPGRARATQGGDVTSGEAWQWGLPPGGTPSRWSHKSYFPERPSDNTAQHQPQVSGAFYEQPFWSNYNFKSVTITSNYNQFFFMAFFGVHFFIGLQIIILIKVHGL